MALPKLVGQPAMRQQLSLIQRVLSDHVGLQQCSPANFSSSSSSAIFHPTSPFAAPHHQRSSSGIQRILRIPSPFSAVAARQRRSFCDYESDGESVTSFNVQDYEDFQDRVINADRPVIVDFHAGWCGPCKLLGPRLESQVDGRDARVFLAKVDVDDNADIAMDYDVQSVPHVISIRDGEVVDKFVGLQEDEVIQRFIDQVDTAE